MPQAGSLSLLDYFHGGTLNPKYKNAPRLGLAENEHGTGLKAGHLQLGPGTQWSSSLHQSLQAFDFGGAPSPEALSHLRARGPLMPHTNVSAANDERCGPYGSTANSQTLATAGQKG